MNTDEILKKLYNACNPFQPASADHYLDCAEARGDSALTFEFQRRLALVEKQHLSFLFSGHIGCGKSSELEALRRKLESPNPVGSNQRYFPVLINVSDYLDDYDVNITDILLAVVTELSSVLQSQANVSIKDGYLTKRLRGIQELALSDIKIEEGELPLWQAKVKIQLLKKDPTARQKVREALIPHMTSILDEINLVLERAREEVKKIKVGRGEKKYFDIVLMLDNLEKIRKIEGVDEGLKSQHDLFLDRYAQLTGMKAHVIYTVPLRLVRSPEGPQLEAHYSKPLVLPMIKVLEHGSRSPHLKGIDFLRDLLQRRLPGIQLDQLFEADALKFLLEYSGGHIRNLMTLVQDTCTYADTVPIPLKSVHKAIQHTVRNYSASVPEGHWAKLAKLDLSRDQLITNGDTDYLTMLENLSVLEYMNDCGDSDPFVLAAPWYAVNPIVRELKQFKSAKDGLGGIVL